jgi:flagellar hook-associated protein 1 FlgK
MSLDASLNIAFSSLRVTEAQLATSSANVTNAGKTGYTTKTYEAGYMTTGAVTTPSTGITVGSINYYLSKNAISDINESGYYSVVSDAIGTVSTAIGTTDGANTLSSNYTTLQSALEALQTSPDDASQKQNVVTAAQTVASELNDLSDTIQTQRLYANQGIETSVDTINSSLNQLDSLNEKIQDLANVGQSTADLEDERMVALESLSEQIGVNYFFDSKNNLQIYTSSGTALLTSTAHELSYSATNYVTDETVYPGGFSGITVDGKDITTSIKGGKIAAYVDLRDTTLVNLQSTLDETATVVSSAINDALGTGTPYPAANTLTGNTSYNGTDSLSATGNLRVAVTSQDGTVQSYTDVDLSSFSTVSDLVSGLNSLSGISASLDSKGYLVISADDSSQGVSLNQMDSAIGTDDFSSYFGVNALFSGDSASNIHVSDALLSDYSLLATGTLSNSATLAVGDKGVSSGNVDAINNVVTALSSKQTFSATGTMGAQTSSIGNYISSVLSSVATQASSASDNADLAKSTYETTKSTLDNATGVNVDEETIKITQYQNQYEAAATIVSTLRDLFTTLLQAVK